MSPKADNLNALLDRWEQNLGKTELKRLDRIAKKWMRRKHAPYRKEVEQTAKELKRDGVYAFNMSPNLGCTTAVTNEGTLLRTLDFSTPGLGAFIEKTEISSPAGNYINFGWQGFSGVATGAASGRFAIAYNEAPFNNSWWKTHFKIPNSKAWPPMWLIRHVLETCKTYNEARYALCTTPLAVPAIFTITNSTGLGCVIERTETEHTIHAAPTVSGNHWNNSRFEGQLNADKSTSEARCDALKRQIESGHTQNFSWCTSPIVTEGKSAFAAEINLSENALNFWNMEKGTAPEAGQLFNKGTTNKTTP